jgi:hypothetical protein
VESSLLYILYARVNTPTNRGSNHLGGQVMSRRKAGSWKAKNIQGMGRKHVGGRQEQAGSRRKKWQGQDKGQAKSW